MINSRIIKTESVKWRELQWFQSKDFKEISSKEKEKLKQSLKNNNFLNPFYVWDDGATVWILDGHHRQLVMNELLEEGVVIAEELPANFIHCKNKKEAAKLVTVFSAHYAKVTRKGFLDFVENFELDIDELSLEVDIPNFSIDKLAAVPDLNIEEDEEENYDEYSEQGRSLSQEGDIWQLGENRLICGDSLSNSVLTALMNGEKATMVFTDPPYNVPMSFISVVQKEDNRWNEFDMASGEMSVAAFTVFLRRAIENLYKFSTEGSIHFICMDWRHTQELLSAAMELYQEWKQLAVWNKSRAGMGTFYRSKHEFVFIFKKGTAPHINNFELGQHGRFRTNVWDYAAALSFSNKSETEGGLQHHPTAKPVKMVADAIIDCSNKNDIILDTFGGSGTTLIAADKTKRRAYLVELSPQYCDVIVRRYIGYCRESKKEIFITKNGAPFDVNDIE